MRELIGECATCSREVFCIDGFFYGVYKDNQKIYCFDCYESSIKIEENPQG